MQIKWVESGGGPLILVPTAHLSQWRGVGGPSEGETDYQRACEVADSVGVVAVGSGDGLILGDEPLPTAWVPNESGGGVLVRWVYADSEAAVVDYIRGGGQNDVVPESGTSVDLAGPCVLFDAAEPGDDIRGDHVAVGLRSGRYVVTSALVDVSPETRILVHQVLRTP